MEYQDPNNTNFSNNNHPSKNSLLRSLGAIIVLVLVFAAGYQSGHKGFIFQPKSFSVINQNEAPQSVDYNLLWKAIDTVNQNYIDKPIDQQKVLYGAVSGAVAAAGDPYTTFFDPSALNNFQTSLQGSFGGIGAEVGLKDGAIVIIAPIDGTPAQRAGLLAGDVILGVNASSTEGWTVDQAVNLIRGPKGTDVTLKIGRQGKSAPFDVKITRDTIQIKSVKWDYKTVNNKTVAVISVSEFGDDTKGLFDQAVNEILKKNVSGIIVDLRNNPGGYLQTAVDMASNWVKEGDLVVSEAHSDGTTVPYKGEGNPRLSGIKTLILINGGSASASEIFSGALHDHGLAQLLGEKSFGKGSVQQLFNLPGGSAVKVTIAKWITPNGVNLNHNGLDPDIKVTRSVDDVTNGKDPQMDAALQQFNK